MENLTESTSSPIHKVLIVGAGAVGGYFGAHLHRSGADITFLLRQTTYDQVSEHGLEIKSIDEKFLLHPAVIQEISEIKTVDLVILSVKCHDVAHVLEQIAPVVKKGAVILTLQNGVCTEEEITSFYKSDCVVPGVAYITARCASPGRIEHFRGGILTLGEISGEKSLRSEQIYQLFSKAKIPCRLSRNIQRTKWEKLCWNATFNPLTVILDHPISLILNTPPLLEMVKRGISEVIAVAAAEGIDLNPDIANKTITASLQFSDYYTSMYEDYKNGKQTEIDYLNGDLVKRGKKAGIPTPTHDMFYALIKGLEKKKIIYKDDLRD